MTQPSTSSDDANRIEISDGQLGQWMKPAIASAKEGVLAGQHPFGAAVFTRDGEQISAHCNTVRSSHNPSAHAEVNAIGFACQRLERTKLSDCWLLSTAEPCPMCLATAAIAGISHIAFGANQAVVTEAGYGDLGINARQLAPQLSTGIELRGSILGNECISLLLKNRKRP